MTLPSLTICGLLLTKAAFAAETTEMKPEQSWQGSAKDDEKAKTVPKIVIGAEKFAEAWKACERTDPSPTIDFQKHFVVILTTQGSRVNPRVVLGTEGDVRVAGMATRDFLPGFRYVIGVYPREGVKTVNGKDLR
jgi:hypothetical protein